MQPPQHVLKGQRAATAPAWGKDGLPTPAKAEEARQRRLERQQGKNKGKGRNN